MGQCSSDSHACHFARRRSWAAIVVLLAVPLLTDCEALAQSTPRSPLECLSEAPYPCIAPIQVGLDAAVLQAFTDDLYEWVEGGRLVGAELLVVKDRQIAWHAAVGWSDRERGLPLERNSVYRIRSMTKPFVGATILMLAEDGRLDLDDRVAEYLPSFDNERSGSISIRHLLTHASGFEQTGFPSTYWAQPGLREAIKQVGEAGPPNPPGERYRYSDHNSATLGAIVAELTGAPVEESIRTRILGPLGLSDTRMHFAPDSTWAARMNSTYSLQDERLVRYWDNSQPQDRPWFRASGGVYSTVFDYARWLEVWMEGGTLAGVRILSPETVGEAFRPGYAEGYGLHWELFSGSPAGAKLPAFGHGGSDGTFAIAYPYADAMILFFTQSRGARGPWQEALQRLPSLVGMEGAVR
jgi:CubicO group peptidase (beta-lactamase class C family)